MADKNVRAVSAWEGRIVRAALLDSVRKLDPRLMAKNPVMFVVEIGSVLTTFIWLHDLVTKPAGAAPALFTALLVSVIVIVGALTFFPALSLGPIVEHLLMRQGQVF